MSKGSKPQTGTRTTSTKKPSQKPQKERFLSEEELSDLRETFDLFDDDKSGTIDASEISKVLEDLGLDQRNPVVYAMVQDLQNFGQPIDFESFVDIITDRLGNNKTRDGVQRLFNLYDTDGTGYIDFVKLKVVAKELGETMNDEELEEMIHHIHVLKKTEVRNQINFEEFYSIVTAPRRY